MLRVPDALRIARIGEDIEHRREREGSFVEARMWDDRRRLVRPVAVGPEEVEVDETGTVSLDATHSAELTLDREQLLDQLDGRDRRRELDEQRAVEEGRLRGSTDRLGLVERRAPHGRHAGERRHALGREADRSRAVPKVRPHPDDGAHGGTQRRIAPPVKGCARVHPVEPVDPNAAAIAALAVVGLAAGLVDAIAGGGGMLTLPALLASGLPPHLALGTNKGCSTWGTAMATVTFARRGRLRLRRTAAGFLAGCAGALLGARLQLALDPKALRPIVLALLLAVAVILTVQRPKPTADDAAVPPRPLVLATMLGLCLGVYDGFFGPGTGTFLIVAQVALLHATMSEATADAKPVNLGSNVASLATFALKGTVIWKVALPMALGNILGGAIGARIAMRGGDRVVRLTVIGVSLALVAKLTWDLLGR